MCLEAVEPLFQRSDTTQFCIILQQTAASLSQTA